ncbi:MULTISPECIES: stressosome-associated protein Prli42 [Paenibacillus]
MHNRKWLRITAIILVGVMLISTVMMSMSWFFY